MEKMISQFWRVRGSTNFANDLKSSIFNVPVYFNGIGKVKLGSNISFGYNLAPKIGNGAITIQARNKNSIVIIGNEVEFSNNITIIALEQVTIGNKCLIADFVFIVDSDFHDVSPESRNDNHSRLNSDGIVLPTAIKDNVWIGARSIILKGVSIGEGTVIGAGSVVTQNIPDRVLACGIPAKVVKSLKDII